MEGRINLKTADNIERYALIVEMDNFLVFHKNNKKSANLVMEGLDTVRP